MAPFPRPGRSVGTLEALAGFAEDVNTQTIDALRTPGALEEAVRTRFGPNVTLADVTEALDALHTLR